MTEADRIPVDSPNDIDALARTYTDALRGFFKRRILQQADVDDLVQEVFLRLTRRGVEDVVHAPAYLFETAANVLKDRVRQRIRHHSDQHDELDERQAHEAAFTPERVFLGREAVRRLAAILDTLPERTRTVFVLRRYEGLSYETIARRIGVSVSSVEKHMAKALPYVAARMEDGT